MTFSKREEEVIFKLAEDLTGSSQSGSYRKEILISNVKKRIYKLGKNNLIDYLKIVKSNPQELQSLISDLTIHTTSWFRELPHFRVIEKYVTDNREVLKNRKIKIWCSACSSGEEPYSVALYLEFLKLKMGFIEYEIFATDIDQVVVGVGKRGTYSADHLRDIPPEYRSWITVHNQTLPPTFSINESIRKKVVFKRHDLNDNHNIGDGHFDLILCRNVLIYFEPSKLIQIVKDLSDKLIPKGLLILGHSEALNEVPKSLKFVTNSSYRRFDNNDSQAIKSSALQRAQGLASKVNSAKSFESNKTDTKTKRKILNVDDSKTVRISLQKAINANLFEIFQAENAEQATFETHKRHFDLITLDLNMPGENGASWLRRFRSEGNKNPVVIISDSSPQEAEKVFGALKDGAQEYLVKSDLSQHSDRLNELLVALTGREAGAAQANFKMKEFSASQFKPEIIVIGGSTGGPDAFEKVLTDFPKDTPPVVIVQHISPKFAKSFYSRMVRISGLKSSENKDQEELLPGHLYMSLTDAHVQVAKKSGRGILKFSHSEKVYGHRPSVEILFNSVAESGFQSIAVLLTGMGIDGAHGLDKISNNTRSYCIAQDETSSVVFGMPKKALELGSVHFSGDLIAIKKTVINRSKGKKNADAA